MTIQAPLLAVLLLALLVGAAVPVLYQLYQVLKRARAVLDTAGPRLERALDQVGEAADRLNGIGSTLEAQAQALTPIFDAASKVGHSIDFARTWLGTAMTVGGAVGPAVIAGMRGLFSWAKASPGSDAHPDHRGNEGNGSNDQQPRLSRLGDTL